MIVRTGAHSFAPEAPIAMGGAAQAFTNNYELTSLGAAHGCPVQPFAVSHWLAHGEKVPLCPAADGAAPPDGAAVSRHDIAGIWVALFQECQQYRGGQALELEVLHIPGHTPDHIALWWESEALLFVGDHIYPWTAIDVSGLGHSLPDFVASTELLL